MSLRVTSQLVHGSTAPAARELPACLARGSQPGTIDNESEAVLQRNMAAICQGRTVIIIAHRLSSVRHAHRIIAMDRGRIVEQDSHNELLKNTKGLYAYLWAMQSGGKPT